MPQKAKPLKNKLSSDFEQARLVERKHPRVSPQGYSADSDHKLKLMRFA